MNRLRIDVARGLAFACLAGPWERSALRERVIVALGRSHPWLEALVAAVRREFAEPPHHDSASLVKFIAGFEFLGLEAWSPTKRPRIVHWFPSHARSQPLRFDLPLLDTVDDVARLLDVSDAELSWFADRSGRLRSAHEQLRHYTSRWIPKRRGGFSARRSTQVAAQGYPANTFALHCRSHPDARCRARIRSRPFCSYSRGRRFQTFTSRVVHEEGFALNLRKTRLMTAGRRQEVVGLVVNRHPNVRREALDALRATLHNCATQGPALQNHAGHGNFREHLLGRVSWVEAVSPEKGRKLRAMFERIAW